MTPVTTAEFEGAGAPRRASPWAVRTTLVRVLQERSTSLTVRDLEAAVAQALGAPLVDPIDADIESLVTLGVLAESSDDDRRLVATELANRYIVGAEVLANE